MKNSNFKFALTIVATALLYSFTLFAQDQALYFNGKNQYAEFTAPDNMPSGSAPRTIEFWMKSDLRTGAKDNHEAIIELGEQTHNGSAFGIFTYVANGKTYLGFWGHNADKGNLAVIPDDQWHFVAITYQEPNITCYIDGEFVSQNEIITVVGGQRLNTKTGKCYLGGNPNRGWYFKGAIDNVAIWNTIRTADQIKQDMTSYPCLQGIEAGLVAYFPLNEGSGTTFKSKNNTITGNLKRGQWTRPIEDNPEPISEGIWFVIQNKSDVDTDYDIPARRMALKTNGTGIPTMAPIPLTGDFDEFLWRTLALGDGRYKLINKKLGNTLALDCSQQNPTIGQLGNYSGQQWTLEQSNVANHGTNVYTLTNEFITNSKALQYSNNAVTVTARNASDTRQCWVFQPIKLVAGYHIPTIASDCFDRSLSLPYGYKLVASNTVSDWAILNAHLIYKNILGAILSNHAQTIKNNTTNKKTVVMISKDDPNEVEANKTPYIYGVFDSNWIAKYRGGASGKGITLITEEMMNKIGVYHRGDADKAYREFEQVVHEFAHAIDFVCNLATSKNSLAKGSAEWFPWAVQYWFNSAHSVGAKQYRQTRTTAERDYIGTIFNAANTWLPPRKLRNR